MGEKCSSHDGICEQITEVRISQARTEEAVKPIPEMKTDIQAIKQGMNGMKSFAGGVSFTISLVMGLLTLGIAFWKAGVK